MSRTPWKYAGGPALLYPDTIDTVGLWSHDPHAQLNQLENFCRHIESCNERSSKELNAVKMTLDHIDQLRSSMRRGDIYEAVSHALAVGLLADGLALSHEFGRDLEAGQRQREGGLEGSRRMPGDRNVHTRWISLNRELEGTIKSQRARAAEIALRTGSNPETIRKYLNRR